MPERENVYSVAREWVVKAENDLKAAAQILKLANECPTDTVCFHAQQCVEKYVKALLTVRGTDFPKTHDLEQLIALLPTREKPRLNIVEQRRLTAYATGARYPGSGIISLTEARRAVTIARRVRREIRGHLPKPVLSKRSRLRS